MGEEIENGTIHVGEIIGKTLDGKNIYKFTELGTAENVEIREPQYKDGDFVVNMKGSVLIFKKKVEDRIYDHALFNSVLGLSILQEMSSDSPIMRHANEWEKERLLDALAKKGKRWNEEEKCIEDIPKRKFKNGDKVTLKSGCISKTDLEYSPFFDRYIGERLEVVSYTESGNVQCNNYFIFHEDWLELYVEELKEGDFAIFWDSDQSEARIGVYNQFYDGSPFPHEDHIGNGFKNAVKFESKKQFKRFIKGEL